MEITLTCNSKTWLQSGFTAARLVHTAAPCWCHFIKALHAVDLHDIAAELKAQVLGVQV